ncbi:MAG: response regulator [Desulfuromonadales bacterium]|nr:response regulator [Desulfuromonadales bacterium]
MKNTGTIMVVDDNLETLIMIVNILQAEGYRTLPANSGELALNAMDSQLPDLVLLDIRMPGIDGFEVCRQIKKEERTRHIPIIFLSAEADRKERVDVFDLGAVDFISKPFCQEELLARISTHLELWRLRQHLEEANCKLSQTNTLLHEEITERRQTEEALRESEQKFAKTFHSSPVAMALSTLADGLFLDVNEQFLRFNERSREEVIGRTALELGFWDASGQRQAIVADLLAGGTVHNRELPVLTKSGELRTVIWSGEIVIIGKEPCLLSSAMDITERKKTEEENKELILGLQEALSQVKTLKGILPICSYCKKIRDDKGYWELVESYVTKHTDALFSHGMCPECYEIAMNEIQKLKIKE